MNANQPIQKELSKSAKFFAVCGGSTLHTLYKAKPDDQHKRINAGIVVVCIAAVSAILASIAWSIPMGPLGYIVGPIWFAIMLLLERSILQQMDVVASHKLAKQWLNGTFTIESQGRAHIGIGWLLMRFTMILFICYFNSEMVRIIMFKPEIVSEIKLRQDKETSHIVDSINLVKDSVRQTVVKSSLESKKSEQALTDYVESFNVRISAIDDSVALLQAKLPYEVKGPGGISGNPGDGPVAQSIRETILAFQSQRSELIAQRDSAKTSSVQAQSLRFSRAEADSARVHADSAIAQLSRKEAELKQQVMDRPVNGLAFMLSVLNDISGRNILIWAVFFMFFFIEGIPVLLKFFSPIDSFNHIRALEYLEMIKDSNKQAADIYKTLKQLQSEGTFTNGPVPLN